MPLVGGTTAPSSENGGFIYANFPGAAGCESRAKREGGREGCSDGRKDVGPSISCIEESEREGQVTD